MKDLETIVLSKIGNKLKKEAAKADLTVGEHKFDFFAHVIGTVKVGEDYEQVVAQSAKPWALLAAALNRLNGVTVASLVAEAEALAAADVQAVKDSTADALASIKAPTVKTCKGKVTFGKDTRILATDMQG